ncbi:hypothetical protein [Myxococcus stipitatus]|uniref:hypothetical protein n=1 Tax=Myxococcus stipitatus TaxID=83455 RepID=UPI0030D3796C
MGLFSRLFESLTSPKKSNPPRIVVHDAFDGAIRVIEAPTSDGWHSAEEERRGEDFSLKVLKYILPLEPMPLALLAKSCTVDAGGEPPDDPGTKDWQAVFQSLFSSVSKVETRVSKQLTMTGTLMATEAILEGLGAEPAVSLCIRERRAVLGQEEFIVTAIGSPDAFKQYGPEIDQWFSTVAFVPMG